MKALGQSEHENVPEFLLALVKMDILGGISVEEIELSSSVPIPGNDLFDADFVKNLFTETETR